MLVLIKSDRFDNIRSYKSDLQEGKGIVTQLGILLADLSQFSNFWHTPSNKMHIKASHGTSNLGSASLIFIVRVKFRHRMRYMLNVTTCVIFDAHPGRVFT